MSLYYESHVTIEPPHHADDLDSIKGLCRAHGFRIAELLMQKRPNDTPERSKHDTFCSTRSVDLEVLQRRMFDFVRAVVEAGYQVWRYKIEDVIIDSKVDDSLLRLDPH